MGGRAHRRLGRAGAYWTAAAVALIALWTSGAPSTSYPLYSAEWDLSPVVVTAVFGTYPVALVVTLLLTGSLSDHVGRRIAILLGVAGMLVGTLLFAVALDVQMLFVGRAFMGIGVGLALSPASAAVLEFSKRGRARVAASVTTAATALGVVLSTVVGGGLVQYGPFPLSLDYWVLIVVIVVVGVLVVFLPEPAGAVAVTSGRWRPSVDVAIPPGQGLIFATAALAASIAYMTGGILLALGASIARQLLDAQNSLVIGSLLGTMFVVAGIVAVVSRRLGPRVSMRVGGIFAIGAFVLFAVSALLGSVVYFLLAAAFGGGAYAAAFSGGLGYVSLHAPPHHRAGAISAFYLAAYASQGAVAVVLGLVATFSSLLNAVMIGAVSMIVLSAVLVVLTLIRRRRPGAPTTRALAVARDG
ncbi:MFS transporter [Herbiconiux sp. VKM Ac-1786]|uniref:MFS transporter n=1 Tax=Herbiconiux sp. VKM Ac-1786 TaxID=2783824 RepID=UPI00188C4193|nr:MFS transporter [Herbiconiux sp. VKM Ac-1786]MBF4571152.1 MFS transporter [Herbiconiux sp. VKM Ac-1786]